MKVDLPETKIKIKINAMMKTKIEIKINTMMKIKAMIKKMMKTKIEKVDLPDSPVPRRRIL